MSAKCDLRGLYQEWKEITENEGLAIRSSDWHEVRDRQSAKLLLQRRIISATAALKREVAEGLHDREEVESEFRTIIDDLIKLEKRNSQWLMDQRRLAELQRNEALSQAQERYERQISAHGSSSAWQS
jgi:hypothetical protein